jgi:hypothetical protein
MSIESIAEAVIYELKKPSTEKELLVRLRTNIEPYIYNYLTVNYYSILQKAWENYAPPLTAKYAYVVVERRCHPNFDFILKNIAWANPNMSVYIFCSDVNEQFVLSLLGDKARYFNIVQAFTGDVSREQGLMEYNTLMTTKEMYGIVDAEYMLTIQMDVFIRRPLEPEIFVGDYWGAPWIWNPNAAGGGGATIRKISSMIELCTKNIYHGDPLKDSEDIWICERVEEMGYEVPDIDFRATRIMESVFVRNPFIIHQFWSFLGNCIDKNYDELVDYLKTLLTLA